MKRMRCSIVRFPGSNCDYDSYYVLQERNHQVRFIWHKDNDLQEPDIVILPGGFSYGDYLRCGIIARFSPIVGEVIKFANRGGLVLGICNGFQILTECGLLPGVLMMNRDLKFVCQHQKVKVCNNKTPFSNIMAEGELLDFPIAHKDGNFFIDDYGLQQLQDNDQIVFRYYNDNSSSRADSRNPNGSLDDIAGIINQSGNVLGLMPHPERNAEVTPTKDEKADGTKLFASLESFFQTSI
jgi:phosphoribosylformylglycinamidine synthase